MPAAPRSPLMGRLVELVSRFGAVVEGPALLQLISDSAHDLLSAYAVGVVVREGDELLLAHGSGPRPELLGRRFPMEGSAIEALLASGRRSLRAEGPVYPHLNDELFDSDPLPLAVALTRMEPDSAAGVYVLRAEPLTEDELGVLELLAAHAGAAMQTAEVFMHARELEQAKDLFLATASHELRTPLTVIRGFAETLINHWDELGEDRRRELVGTILTRTQRMMGLVEQLLLGSRAGLDVPVSKRQFDLAAAVRTIVGSLAGSSVAHPLLVDAPGPLRVHADESLVDAVLGQLFENAVKYSPEGGLIEVSLRVEDERAVLRVADRGQGIEEADLARVFDRFTRGSHRDTPRAGGAGLGLWIVRRYVEAQGGQVRAVQRDGGGTVVEVRLPLA